MTENTSATHRSVELHVIPISKLLFAAGTFLALAREHQHFNAPGANMWNWISCYVTGHDYSVCCDGGAMFLRCNVCGRRSQGWVVHGGHNHQHPHTQAQGTRA